MSLQAYLLGNQCEMEPNVKARRYEEKSLIVSIVDFSKNFNQEEFIETASRNLRFAGRDL